ncbi:MAG TPA: hypothetical protein VF085_07525 [Solirubrobacterales bacterium]
MKMKAIGSACAVPLVLVALSGVSAAAPIERSPSPPPWASKHTDCTQALPSVPGKPADGYSASLLEVVGRKHVSCHRAKQLSLADWRHGHQGQALRWHTRRQWRSTSGSAYFGDFVGRQGRVRVEYYAIH